MNLSGQISGKIKFMFMKEKTPLADNNPSEKNETEEYRREIESEVLRKIKEGRSREELINGLKTRAAAFSKQHSFDLSQMNLDLDALAEIKDDAVFAKKIVEVLNPLIELKFSNPKVFASSLEAVKRENFIKQGGFEPLNQLLSFGFGPEGKYVHIHVAPNKETENKLGLIKDGLHKLAEKVKADERIERIEAVSWIVADHPNLLKKLGFEIRGSVDEESGKKMFPHEDRTVASAFMTRDELLRRYS